MLPADWPDLPDEQLLDARLADLPLTVSGSLAERVAQIQHELATCGLRLDIHFYLSDEWFTPDGATSIAIPFYLAHPRLEMLEEAQMLEVEGGEPEWGMRILRHEAGHAIDNAFRLRLRRQRREIFGSPSVPYPEFYTPKPYSKSFVLHLDAWYAQSHPDEDFAETFAVWLTPSSEWRQRYLGWPAMKKIEYMDVLMHSLRDQTPRVQNPEEVDPLRKLRKTLRQHYRNKRRHYGVDHPGFYDRDLRRIFSDAPECASNTTAAQFISRIRRPVRRVVASWTGIYQYTIDQVLEDMIARCRELKLRLAVPEDQARQEFTVLLTVQTMNHLHSGGHRLFL
jgi:Putative zinc-binding metallo-peptidase